MNDHRGFCHHEAGHCLAALKHCGNVSWLIANRTANEYECRISHPGNFGKDPVKIEEGILIHLAGPVAEQFYLGKFFFKEAYLDDVSEILERLKIGDRLKIPKDWTADDFFAKHAASARIFVQKNWRAISFLAAKLEIEVYMKGTQVERFLKEFERGNNDSKFTFYKS